MAKAAKMVKREVVEFDTQQGAGERRVIRSQYLAIKNLISDRKDDIISGESDKFHSVFSEVESLYQFVQKPREQVADAEALLDIANTLVTAFKSQTNDGLTPSEFVTALIRKFGPKSAMKNVYNDHNTVIWGDIGYAVSHVFRKAAGCCTMIGPMKSEIKQRTSVASRKRTRAIESTRPEELVGNEEGKSDTDKNMFTMFAILREKRSVRLESLVLNRVSFAQTIENIFALSFLVKDGRAEINVNDAGQCHVCPRNAPSASSISSGQSRYHHFVFRFDYKDWKLMAKAVEAGDELMPHRDNADTAAGNSQGAVQTLKGCHSRAPPMTPIRKFSKNRGLLVQAQAVEDSSPEEKAIK